MPCISQVMPCISQVMPCISQVTPCISQVIPRYSKVVEEKGSLMPPTPLVRKKWYPRKHVHQASWGEEWLVWGMPCVVYKGEGWACDGCRVYEK